MSGLQVLIPAEQFDALTEDERLSLVQVMVDAIAANPGKEDIIRDVVREETGKVIAAKLGKDR